MTTCGSGARDDRDVARLRSQEMAMLDDVAWLRGPRAGGRSSSSAIPAGRRALPRKPPGSARPGHPLLFPRGWTPVPVAPGADRPRRGRNAGASVCPPPPRGRNLPVTAPEPGSGSSGDRMAAVRRLEATALGSRALQRLTGLAVRLLRADAAAVSLLGDVETVVAGDGLPAGSLARQFP